MDEDVNHSDIVIPEISVPAATIELIQEVELKLKNVCDDIFEAFQVRFKTD